MPMTTDVVNETTTDESGVVTITLDPNQSVAEVFKEPTGVNAQSAMRISAVYACVRLLAGAKAGLPLDFYKRQNGARELLDAHSLWYLFNIEPSPICSAAVFWEYIEACRHLQGDGFAYINRNRAGEPIEIIPLIGSDVAMARHPAQKNRLVYRIQLAESQTVVDQDDILHFRNFGFDPKTGRSMSTLSFGAQNAVRLAQSADKHAESFYARGTTSKVVLTYPNKLNETQKNFIREQFQIKYGGVDNAGVPLVMGEGGTVQTISINAKDAQLLESRQYQLAEIARAFGVPPFMIGSTEKTTSWGSGVSEMSQGFINYTLSPHLVRDEQELVRKLFAKKDIYVEFDRDSLLRSDYGKRAEYYRQAIGGSQGPGWVTVNEVRAWDKLKPIEGGDALYSGATSPQQPKDKKDAQTAQSADEKPAGE